MSDCLSKIEERIGFKFEKGQVVHTFGQTMSSITVNGLDIEYVEPSRISDDRNIRVVFFKENLSTGWDCPRAETMMSFRHATDATYIAQLLGRMVRTPMQMHIQVDDVLNDVHLYLPYFNAATVKSVVDALQSSEGGEIPTDVVGQTILERKYDTLTVKPRKKIQGKENLNQMNIFDYSDTKRKDDSQPFQEIIVNSSNTNHSQQVDVPFNPKPSIAGREKIYADDTDKEEQNEERNSNITEENTMNKSVTEVDTLNIEEPEYEELFDREEVMKFINDSGLLSYNVRSVTINDYLVSSYADFRCVW